MPEVFQHAMRLMRHRDPRARENGFALARDHAAEGQPIQSVSLRGPGSDKRQTTTLSRVASRRARRRPDPTRAHDRPPSRLLGHARF